MPREERTIPRGEPAPDDLGQRARRLTEMDQRNAKLRAEGVPDPRTAQRNAEKVYAMRIRAERAAAAALARQATDPDDTEENDG